MTDSPDLFPELQPDVEQLTDALFESTAAVIRKEGAFLPHGAVLTFDNEVEHITAAPPGVETRALTSVDVLPFLHDALRAAAADADVKAVALCEDVWIETRGLERTKAIKVLVEHQRGLCVAVYFPYSKVLLRGWTFGETMALAAEPEVRPSFGRADA